MTRPEWLRSRFTSSVSQGIGSWMEGVADPDLGAGVFEWNGGPTIRLFEAGFSYDGDRAWTCRYDELKATELLDLRALMKAQKEPMKPVEFAVSIGDVRQIIRVPLVVYTTLSAVLDAIARGER